MIIIDQSRREFIAKLISDLGKTIFAVGLASYFFEKFPAVIRVVLSIVCVGFIIASIFIQPRKGDN